MKKIAVLILSCLIGIPNAFASHAESLFYMIPDQDSQTLSASQVQQIKDHANSIDIIAPQIFQLDENGVISGKLDPALVTLAKDNHIKLMPLIVNANFEQEKFHQLVQNDAAQEKAISGMLELCEQNHLYGIQFDFLNVNVNDREGLTRFFQKTAERLHQRGFALSIAVVQPVPENSALAYEQWYYKNWSGAYDFLALTQSGDFITLMLWDRHTSLTTPGPIAAYDWMENTITNLLANHVPADKISLGMPAFSGYWRSGTMDPLNGTQPEKYRFRSRETQLSYSTVLKVLQQFNQTLSWNEQWQSSYAMYSNNYRNEYLFVEDVKSFEAKMKLVKQYNLRGISMWKLGMEDPGIWKNQDISR